MASIVKRKGMDCVQVCSDWVLDATMASLLLLHLEDVRRWMRGDTPRSSYVTASGNRKARWLTISTESGYQFSFGETKASFALQPSALALLRQIGGAAEAA